MPENDLFNDFIKKVSTLLQSESWTNRECYFWRLATSKTSKIDFRIAMIDNPFLWSPSLELTFLSTDGPSSEVRIPSNAIKIENATTARRVFPDKMSHVVVPKADYQSGNNDFENFDDFILEVSKLDPLIQKTMEEFLLEKQSDPWIFGLDRKVSDLVHNLGATKLSVSDRLKVMPIKAIVRNYLTTSQAILSGNYTSKEVGYVAWKRYDFLLASVPFCHIQPKPLEGKLNPWLGIEKSFDFETAFLLGSAVRIQTPMEEFGEVNSIYLELVKDKVDLMNSLIELVNTYLQDFKMREEFPRAIGGENNRLLQRFLQMFPQE